MRPHSIGLLATLLISAPGPRDALAADVPSEWTIEGARRCWKPMTRAVQHVGAPGYQFQCGVLWDGALVFGPLDFRGLEVMKRETAPLGPHDLHVSFAYGDRMRFADRTGAGDPRVRRSLLSGRLPIPSVEARDGDIAWKETVFAHLLDAPLGVEPEAATGDTLVVHALFEARNVGLAKRSSSLWMHFGNTGQVRFGYKCVQLPEIGREIPWEPDLPRGKLDGGIRFVVPRPEKGEISFHEEVPDAEGIRGTPRRVLEWKVTLAPGENAELRLLLPYGVVDAETARRVAGLDSRAELARTARFWGAVEHGPGQIVTPDPFVNDYLAAVAGQMAQQVAHRVRSTGVWMYKTSPNHYEGYWPCNAAKALPALDLRGLGGLARRVLQGFIASRTDDVGGLARRSMGRGEELGGEGFAKADGFLGNFGEWTANPLLLSHGLGMWALAAHYRISRDDAWLRGGPTSPLETLLAAFDWVSLERKRTQREVEGKRVPYWGLLPAASAHDWLAGNTIFNDAFCIYGMAETVRLLREIRHPRAGELAAELKDYRRCLRDRYADARDRARALPLPDGTSIPFVPRMVQELDWTQPDWTYTGYGPLRAGAWGAIDPGDELVSQSLAVLEAGMPKGEGPYFANVATADNADVNFADISDPGADRHYLWRHYVEYETMWPVGGPLFLARDDLPRYFEWFAHNLAFAVHRDFRVGVESFDGVPSCAPGDGERWLTVRRMLVHEAGGFDGSEQALWLLQAVPREWLRPRSTLSVVEMGTFFGGKVDLHLEVAAGGNSAMARVHLRDLAVEPAEIRVRLRSGDGRPLRAAEVDGKPAELLGGDWVRLPTARSRELTVVGRFAED